MQINGRQVSAKPLLLLMLLFVGMAAKAYFEGLQVHWWGFASMMLFYLLIFGTGMYAASLRKSNTTDDVLLAGRKLPLGVAVFTMSATWVGGGYVNGAAEYAASSGLAWVQAPWGYALSLVVGGLFFAKKMRRHNFKTMLDPLEQRYGKTMSALLFLPALTGELFWTSAILTALGTTFGTILGFDFNTSIVVSALVAILYTALGGLWAVALTDILQLLLLLVGLALVVPFVLGETGGWEKTWATYAGQKGSLSSFLPPAKGWQHPDWGNYYWNWWDCALLLIFGGIPWQVYFQRVLAAKDERTAQRLSFVAGLVCLLAAVPPVIIGIAGSTVDWAAMGLPAPESAAHTLPHVLRYLTPPLVATIGLGAVAAAVMSSVDSSVLSASSMLGWNVYRPLLRPNIQPPALLKVTKRCIWIVGVAATLLALRVKSVYALWFLCSDLVYCILFPQLVTALFDPKANKIGSAAGFAVALFLRAGGGEPALHLPRFLPYPMVQDGLVLFPFRTFAMLGGLLAIVVVSRLTQKWSPPRTLERVGDKQTT